MPTLAIIDGIRIMMYLDDHPPPHVHAFMSGREAQFEILTGSQMEGELDRRSMRKVKLWIESNRTFLMEQWKKCQSNTSPTTTR